MIKLEITELQNISNFVTLVNFLVEKLHWPIQFNAFVDRFDTFYSDQFEINEQYIANIQFPIKQLRPLIPNQPWNIFYIEFESKNLPILVLRRTLKALVKNIGQSTIINHWNFTKFLLFSVSGETNKRQLTICTLSKITSKIKDLDLKIFSLGTSITNFRFIQSKIKIEQLVWPESTTDSIEWEKQWSNAFYFEPRNLINSSNLFINDLVELAKKIREQIILIYSYENKTGFLHELVLSLKKSLLQDLDIDKFSDLFAQTITYSLFSAKITDTTSFNLEEIHSIIEATNPFLKSFYDELKKHENEVSIEEFGIIDLIDLLQKVNGRSILQELNLGLNNEDPIIHFYELFLYKYNPKLRELRGVYYTPDPVVKFIIQSVDWLITEELGLEDGLGNNNRDQESNLPIIQILDPAVGTGKFLIQVLTLIREKWIKSNKHLTLQQRKDEWQKYIKQQILQKITGIEILLPAYAIAHLNMRLKLLESGYVNDFDDYIRIILSNALQGTYESTNSTIKYHNGKELNKNGKNLNNLLSNTKINVIIGNPPYSGHSANKNEWITNLMRGQSIEGTRSINYFELDGEKLGEKNPKFLNDDYVKFILYSQWIIEKTGYGIVGFVTNHGYLDNPTFRGMRYELLKTFNKIFILDLHGNIKKKEKSPDGSKDENIFDIQQGVSIAFFIKVKDSTKHEIYHSDVYGSRKDKNDFLRLESVQSIKWKNFKPFYPWYIFHPLDTSLWKEYSSGWSIKDIFSEYSVGIMTGMDEITIKNTKKEIEDVVYDLAILTEQEFKRKYAINKERRQWTYKKAKTDVLDTIPLASENEEYVRVEIRKKIIKLLYRPFDVRYTFYTGNSTGFHERPRNISKNMIYGTNIGLIISRNSKPDPWRDIQVTDNAIELGVMATKPGNNAPLFPLYLCTEKNGEVIKTSNINKDFLQEIRSFYHEFDGNISENIFYYIVALLYSKIYRERYESFLKIDFPMVLFPKNPILFQKLVNHGKNLSNIHLFKNKLENTLNIELEKENEKKIIVKTISIKNNRVYINKKQWFNNIPLDVLKFHIGGYRVIDKWLKRYGSCELTTNIIKQFKDLVNIIHTTNTIMEQIDAVIRENGSFPDAFFSSFN